MYCMWFDAFRQSKTVWGIVVAENRKIRRY